MDIAYVSTTGLDSNAFPLARISSDSDFPSRPKLYAICLYGIYGYMVYRGNVHMRIVNITSLSPLQMVDIAQ